MPDKNSQLQEIAKAAAEEMIAQVRGIAGDLPDEWKAKANLLAEKAVSLAGRYARREISKEEFLDFTEDLKLWARSEFAGSMLDAWGKRKALINAFIPVLVKTLVTVATTVV